MEWYLAAQQPFSLPAVVRSHGWVRLAPFQEDETTGGFDYTTRLDNGLVTAFHVAPVQEGVQISVDQELDEASKNSLSQQVAWMVGLDMDLSEFYALSKQEPKLAHVESKAAGRVLRSPTLFEDVIKTIMTTNTLWAHTIRMAHALVEHYGEPVPGNDTLKAFPTAERLAALDADELRTTARMGYRAPYVTELARSIVDGDLDLEQIKSSDMPTPELRKRLISSKGIGNYAAANLLMILGRYDYIPVDSWALKVVSHEWHQGEKIGPGDVEAAFEGWGAWKGLAYWFWNWDYQWSE